MTFKPVNKSIEEFKDYDGFVNKFSKSHKKTTDDCYTPPEIYKAVFQWVKDEIGIPENSEIIRPFYPGGDYENEDYMGKIVIDNPPFSILAKIIEFYQSKNIKFFLFAPGLTCMAGKKAAMENLTAVFAANTKSLRYENGARVNTAFLTNMAGDLKIWSSESLGALINSALAKIPNQKDKIKNIYPENMITTSKMEYYGDLKINRKDTIPIKSLDAQRKAGKSIFGNGFLLSTKATQAAQAARIKKKEIEQIWELSEREKKLLVELDS